MNNLDLLTAITVFVLSVLVGIEVISKVPATLHTPLMSGSNSVHGIVVIGAMLIAAGSHTWLGYVLAFVAMAFGAMNVVGGYVVTDRMLEMFKARPTAGTPGKPAAGTPDEATASTPDEATAGARGEAVVGAPDKEV